MQFVFIVVSISLWSFHCWQDGARDAYTFAISQQVEATRRTKSWRYSTVHWLLLLERIVPLVLLAALSWFCFKGPDGLKLWFGLAWWGDRIRNGAMRVEQYRSFFEGGHTWFITMPWNCPRWVLAIGHPVVSVRRGNTGWIWEFRELGGKTSFIIAVLALAGAIYWSVA